MLTIWKCQQAAKCCFKCESTGRCVVKWRSHSHNCCCDCNIMTTLFYCILLIFFFLKKKQTSFSHCILSFPLPLCFVVFPAISLKASFFQVHDLLSSFLVFLHIYSYMVLHTWQSLEATYEREYTGFLWGNPGLPLWIWFPVPFLSPQILWFHFFSWLNKILLYVCITVSLFICSLIDI